MRCKVAVVRGSATVGAAGAAAVAPGWRRGRWGWRRGRRGWLRGRRGWLRGRRGAPGEPIAELARLPRRLLDRLLRGLGGRFGGGRGKGLRRSVLFGRRGRQHVLVDLLDGDHAGLAVGAELAAGRDDRRAQYGERKGGAQGVREPHGLYWLAQTMRAIHWTSERAISRTG